MEGYTAHVYGIITMTPPCIINVWEFKNTIFKKAYPKFHSATFDNHLATPVPTGQYAHTSTPRSMESANTKHCLQRQMIINACLQRK
jgi:hypothetical protein